MAEAWKQANRIERSVDGRPKAAGTRPADVRVPRHEFHGGEKAQAREKGSGECHRPDLPSDHPLAGPRETD